MKSEKQVREELARVERRYFGEDVEWRAGYKLALEGVLKKDGFPD